MTVTVILDNIATVFDRNNSDIQDAITLPDNEVEVVVEPASKLSALKPDVVVGE